MTTKLSTTELATEMGIEPKRLRVYLRDCGIPKDPETGRYAFTPAQVKKITEDYFDWETKRMPAPAPTPDNDRAYDEHQRAHDRVVAGCPFCEEENR
ncbi:hypothetical protein [Nocardia cyriacigeorgica]|uniref:hypothetical protein n=1 Tax=Nocardia cyriacigeorgica TaxID=135487 RepID=UPI002456965E|nr:hypothetical protein [Nocardia cyriacigeorgica]BDT88657.1 hypothetical protein FMUAM8_44210 [Nocardia cyriacigeorgica]